MTGGALLIYTSYFSNIRNLPHTITPIAICAYPPRWFTGENYPLLAPSRELLSDIKAGRCTMLDYWDRYWQETLRTLDPAAVYADLLAKGRPDVALLCFEVAEEFCHRFIVSHWFNQTIGAPVREYGDHPVVFGG
jgi:hypothetical protein